MTLAIGSLFAGIGGLELGLERAGLGPVIWQVECDDYATRVLERHWPDAARYRDVREVGRHNLAPVDVICGGFPCQDISNAGKRAGIGGERSGLWREYARIVRELRPRYVLVENVAALLGRGLGDVLGDLAACGYDAEWDCIPAAAVGAPHLRDRLFLVAYARGVGPGRLADAASWDHAGRSDAGREEETGRPPVRREDGRARALADPDRGRLEERSEPHIGAAAGFEAPRRVHTGGCGADVADTQGDGRLEGRAEPAGLVGRSDAAECGADVADAERDRLEGIFPAGPEARAALRGGSAWWEAEPDVGRVVDGISTRMDCLAGTPIGPVDPNVAPWPKGTRVPRLRCLGNAVVPQVAEFIGRRIAAHAGGVT